MCCAVGHIDLCCGLNYHVCKERVFWCTDFTYFHKPLPTFTGMANLLIATKVIGLSSRQLHTTVPITYTPGDQLTITSSVIIATNILTECYWEKVLSQLVDPQQCSTYRMHICKTPAFKARCPVQFYIFVYIFGYFHSVFRARARARKKEASCIFMQKLCSYRRMDYHKLTALIITQNIYTNFNSTVFSLFFT